MQLCQYVGMSLVFHVVVEAVQIFSEDSRVRSAPSVATPLLCIRVRVGILTVPFLGLLASSINALLARKLATGVAVAPGPEVFSAGLSVDSALVNRAPANSFISVAEGIGINRASCVDAFVQAVLSSATCYFAILCPTEAVVRIPNVVAPTWAGLWGLWLWLCGVGAVCAVGTVVRGILDQHINSIPVVGGVTIDFRHMKPHVDVLSFRLS